MEDERCAGAAVVLVSLGGGVEEGRGEECEGEDSVEGNYLVVGLGWGGCVYFICNEFSGEGLRSGLVI